MGDESDGESDVCENYKFNKYDWIKRSQSQYYPTSS
jgi:hypothetical protein